MHEEGQDLPARQAAALVYLARLLRDGNLEDRLCQVDGNERIVVHDGLLLLVVTSDSGTSMPTESPGGVHLIARSVPIVRHE
jgi:hypothetical protein